MDSSPNSRFHAGDRGGEIPRHERLEVVDPLADPDAMHRQPKSFRDRHQDAAARRAVELGHREPGADSASLAYEALEAARAGGTDVLMVDTAGRLQNKAALMGELEKIVRAMKKIDASAPHAVLLVLDATVGQNALSQVEEFAKTAGVTGLMMTKLDGTARGGILVAIAEKFRLPVHCIGIGEGIDDLEPFVARDFAAAIAGVER